MYFIYRRTKHGIPYIIHACMPEWAEINGVCVDYIIMIVSCQITLKGLFLISVWWRGEDV